MSVLEDTRRCETSLLPSIARPRRSTRSPSLLRFAWWTVPIHLLLGFGFWWMVQNASDRLMEVAVGVHVAFPILLLLTVRWWWSRWGELLVLLLINHLATFSVLVCLPWS